MDQDSEPLFLVLHKLRPPAVPTSGERVIRQPQREDQKGLIICPDRADLPYFLPAYFAFKMGLPYKAPI
jgi:hypothetical protein